MTSARETSSFDLKDDALHTEEAMGVVLNEDPLWKKRESRVLRKLDIFIGPYLAVLMILSHLDRSNIGFATTQGMAVDIGLYGNRLNIAVSIFYVFYVLVEIPAAMLVKRLRFDLAIPGVAVAWGVICLCNGFVNNFAGLVVCRLLLGFFEGVLFPANILMMANWYTREELGKRLGFLFVALALASAFGGLIAFGILYMDGVSGLRGWRWLYIIEGLITVVIAFAGFWILPKDYNTAYFLNDDDRVVMRRRAELTEQYNGGQGHYTRKDFNMAVMDIKTWIHGIAQMCIMTVMLGFAVFLPVILRTGFQYSLKEAQYLTAPVFCWGGIAYLAGAWLSDKFRNRFWFVTTGALVGIVGCCLLLASRHVSVGVQYFACYLISTALFSCSGGNIVWTSSNSAPDGKRAATVGILLALTNIGGIISGQIYRTADAPYFTFGHSWCLGSLAVALSGYVIMHVIYARRETWKDQMIAEGRDFPPEDFSDRYPSYRYQR
ncbi:hypothetical protein PV10_04682 [Exophiala mesophila]|uniref:Major facilitator superfamily (MFS) profile domain-containing protein n=1 Tax=Exophiala mesophila TaxID=212818 RepID=A0A0D1WVS2_EXOME|nr:uncharacterized protein PV10_04682 [Exophiala mesophila]KIV93470.1 hypothetical protein PV10_04682 [Exophiala mesophila]